MSEPENLMELIEVDESGKGRGRGRSREYHKEKLDENEGEEILGDSDNTEEKEES